MKHSSGIRNLGEKTSKRKRQRSTESGDVHS